jgi:hypothetical protein
MPASVNDNGERARRGSYGDGCIVPERAASSVETLMCSKGWDWMGLDGIGWNWMELDGIHIAVKQCEGEREGGGRGGGGQSEGTGDEEQDLQEMREIVHRKRGE